MAHVFIKGIHRQQWVQVTPVPNAHAAGMGIACDLRNDLSRNPFIYSLVSNSVLNRFNIITKASSLLINHSLSGTFGAGAGAVFAPSSSINGVIDTGCTNSFIKTSTVIGSAGPGINMLANRGGSGEYGFRLRIISKSAGKIEERWIIGNDGQLKTSFRLHEPLTFIPASGDLYELLSGSIYCLGAGTLGSNSWRRFEVGINALASRSNIGLPASINTEFSAVALDEQYVPTKNKPGEGLVKGTSNYDGTSKTCLVATSSGVSSITGQATGGDSSLLENEYRNFQIRIVEDIVNKTAVGQRRIIASHTAGPNVVYTLGSNWDVTPSVNCKFVIENPNLIILFSSGAKTTFTYNYRDELVNNGTASIAADAWSTTYFAERPTTCSGGNTTIQSFGIEVDEDKFARHSYIYSFRGGNSGGLDVLDIATNTWSQLVIYDGQGPMFNTGSCGKYAPFDNDGRFGYINCYVASATNQLYRFDVKHRVLSPFTPTDLIQSGTAAAGDRLGAIAVFDNDNKYTNLFLINHLSTLTQELIVEV